ncbi:hypothetical protein JCM10207_005328 [Rhodosporidiobolus poonsookiae]
MSAFADLPNELVERIFRHTLDGTPHTNRKQLQRLAWLNSAAHQTARRLLYRWITIATPEQAVKTLELLRKNAALAGAVRTLVIKPEAFQDPSSFTDLEQDDLVRLITNATSFDSPYGSFAPRVSGKPKQAYPQALRSCRLGPPLFDPNLDDMNSEDEMVGGAFIRTGITYSPWGAYWTLLEDLPFTLTTLNLSHLNADVFPAAPPAEPFPVVHLTTLLLDFISVAPAVLEHLVQASPNLEKLKIWSVTQVRGGNTVNVVKQVGGQLKEFLFKPANGHGQSAKLAHELVPHLSNVKRLTLGDKACDHEIWAILPPSLTHLCVALRTHHSNARLDTVSDVITTRLTSLQVLELYSSLYFPPPIEVEYQVDSEAKSTLRELRLSHIQTTDADLSKFLYAVGANLHTLAIHRVLADAAAPLAFCTRLRRLELGARGFLPEQESSYFNELYLPYLSFLRVHLASGVALADLLDALPLLTRPREGPSHLKTLELVGIFPDNLSSDWLSAKGIDRLVEICREGGVDFVMNGRPVETLGELWSALVGQTGREEL